METEQKKPQLERAQRDAVHVSSLHELQDKGEVAPGVPVTRGNTPRPFSFERVIPGSTMGQPGSHFPAKAPSAPPLPEEVGEGAFPPIRLPDSSSRPVGEEAQDFIWLFEYGLEMDPGVLNSPDRLNGLALLYGPAVLKGHTLLYGSMQIGRELATIAPVADPNAEVWGVLYRVPRRLADRNGGEHAVLDMAHFATTAHNFFKPIASIVHEGYRNREIGCITYVAIEQVLCQVSLIPVSQASTQPLVQRLAQIARKQKLPNHYLSTYNWQAAPVSGAATHVGLAAPRAVQDTEPLPAIKDKGNSTPASPRLGRDQETTAESLKPSRWLVGLALYLIVMLLAMLTFAVLQDLGMAELTFVSTLTLLGVPWLVVMYGLLGGCVSSLFSLARSRRLRPPLFVTLTWFARPFVGGVLALLSYLLLTSGAFVISSSNARQQPVFLLAGALAGLCEGWLFFRTR